MALWLNAGKGWDIGTGLGSPDVADPIESLVKWQQTLPATTVY
jgi:hypothetical protein